MDGQKVHGRHSSQECRFDGQDAGSELEESGIGSRSRKIQACIIHSLMPEAGFPADVNLEVANYLGGLFLDAYSVIEP
mgnify:FL=1